MKIGPVLLAVGICAWCTDVRAQETTTTTTATTVTTTKGAFTEFVPASETIVVRTETNPAPLRYVVTKQTTIVDEAGVPIAVEKDFARQPVVSAIHRDRRSLGRIADRGPQSTAPVVTDGPHERHHDDDHDHDSPSHR